MSVVAEDVDGAESVVVEDGNEEYIAISLDSLLQEIKNGNPVLSLQGLGITDDFVKRLAVELKDNHSLKTLILANNDITDEGAIALAEALIINDSITMLVLFGNKIGNKAAKSFADMLNNRKQKFERLYLGNNKFDQEHEKLISDVIQAKHPDIVINFADEQEARLIGNASLYHIQSSRHEAFIDQLISDPHSFLIPFSEHMDDPSVRMDVHGWIGECHCIPLLSRDPSTEDCRKKVEDLFVQFYADLNLSPGLPFKYASLNSSDLFPEVMNIARLIKASIKAGRKGMHIEVDLIDPYKYSDHRILVRNSEAMTLTFQFMSLLYRMGVEVKLGPENKNHRTLLVETSGFRVFRKVFPDAIQDPLATVTLKFYDSINTYTQGLQTGITPPHAVLAIDTGCHKKELKEIQEQLTNKTALFSLEKCWQDKSVTEGDFDCLRLGVSIKNDGKWADMIKSMDFPYDYKKEKVKREERFKAFTAKSRSAQSPLEEGDRKLAIELEAVAGDLQSLASKDKPALKSTQNDKGECSDLLKFSNISISSSEGRWLKDYLSAPILSMKN